MSVPLTRRQLLRRGSGALLGLGLAGSLGSRPPVGGTVSPGEPVGGPLGDVYGRYGAPRGLQLSYAGDPATTRTVTWLTSGEMLVGSRVQFGVVPPGASAGEIAAGGFLRREIVGSSELAPTGSFDDDTGTVTSIDGEVPSRVHRATMTGLREGERIGYRVGDGELWSEVAVFAPIPRRDQGFTFTHFGDHGLKTSSRRSTRAVLQRRPDLHLVAGDISYANGYQPDWDRWSNQVQPLGSHIPIVCSPGNHEAKDYHGETYRRRFTFPNHGRAWWSLDIHNVHLLSVTAGAFLTEQEPDTVRRLVSEELTFMERDLAAAAARRAAGEIDFILVTQHFPLYTDHRTRGPVSPGHAAAEEQILQRYQVDLVLVGHDHMYQRSRPMAYGVPTGAEGGDGPGYVQVVAGGGGTSLYEFTPIDTTEPATDPENPFQRMSLWSAAQAREFSFVEYTVDGPVMRATAFGWLDVEGQNDIPQDPATYEQDLIDVDGEEVDPDRPYRAIDEFELRRKPAGVLGRVPTQPRPTAQLLGGVPEARGIVIPNLAEDCTRHRH